MSDRLTAEREAEIAARRRIADLLWWSVPSHDNDEAKAKAEALLDAFASAVRAGADAELSAVREEIARFGFYGSALTATKALVSRASELVNDNARLRRKVASLKAEQDRDDAEYAEVIAERDSAREALREACDQIAALESDLGGATARIAELEAERLTQNQALDDAVRELRTPYAERARRERHPGRRQAWLMLASAQEAERVADVLLNPKAARSAGKGPQSSVEGEHYAAVHHDYRQGRDLPEMGGAR